MAYDIRNVKNITDLISYFSQNLGWDISIDDFDDIEDISYDFDAEDVGLKEESFAKISSLRQLQPLVDGQKWGIFCVEFDSNRFEVSALRKILSGLIPRRRNSADHAVWCQQDLLFICNWGQDNNRTIGVAHFEDKETGLPQIKMISCAPALEDFTQIKVFEDRLSQLAWPRNTSNIEEWRQVWSSAFTTAYRQTIQDSSTLTIQLAAEAQNIRNRILDVFEVESRNGYVHLLYKKFQDALIHDMTEQQFADMYAQTVVYGLFSARCMDRTQDDFSVEEAVDCIPNTNPFLKSLMKECLGSQNNSKLSFDELEISNVVDLLKATRTDEIIRDFNRQTGGGKEDPVIHFYEEFLTAYDKDQKVQRGVYYTPQPVVNFIVSAVDAIIKSEFGIKDGLASTDTKTIKIKRRSKRKIKGYHREIEDVEEVPAIQVLDPATGTGTFIRQTILQIFDDYKLANKGLSEKELKAAWNQYVPKHLLPRINAFELMMAPYAVTHMKLAMVLKDTGYEFESGERLNVYLTNSLEEPGYSNAQIRLWDDPLATESVFANTVKKNTGINIIMGNPPYAGESANKGEWILSLLEEYKKEPGGEERLNERNPKWINDDYVKFIRLAQEFIRKTEKGILAYICPHGFIDNPTFRGMRWNLAKTYSKIYVLDLHGNAKKRETCPNGSKDENVFDIQQGVCIVLMIRDNKHQTELADIFHADVFGVRDYKYNYLNNTTIQDVQWKPVNSKPPFYLFKPTSEIDEERERFEISKLFGQSVMGFQTHRDSFAISFEKKDIKQRIEDMADDSISDIALQKKYGISDNRDWQIDRARKRLVSMSDNTRNEKTTLCQYRLFDERWCFLDEAFMDYPRGNVFCNVANKDNLVFGVGRQGLAVGDIEWCLATVSKYAMDANIFRRGGVTASPLYIYEETLTNDARRTHNLNRGIISGFQVNTGLKFTDEKCESASTFAPIDVIDYVLAVLYSHKYRSIYNDELKIDYPKIPYPADAEYFKTMVQYGMRLRAIFTKEKKIETAEYYMSEGTKIVDRYKLKDNKIYINKTQFFGSVNDEKTLLPMWEYVIGGNQPLQKWLKDRKGMELDSNDVLTYINIISYIEEILHIMDEIDETIDL